MGRHSLERGDGGGRAGAPLLATVQLPRTRGIWRGGLRARFPGDHRAILQGQTARLCHWRVLGRHGARWSIGHLVRRRDRRGVWVAARVHLDGRTGFAARNVGVAPQRNRSQATSAGRGHGAGVVAAWDARRDALRHAPGDLRGSGRVARRAAGDVRRYPFTVRHGRIQRRCERRRRMDGVAPRTAGGAAHDGGRRRGGWGAR